MSTKMLKNEKSPLSLWKIKCLFLEYIQLLMIGQVIWAKNINRNAKNQKRPPKSLKNQNVHFWITFNFWWSAEQSNHKTMTEAEKNKNGPLSHWKIKCSFLDYIQLLMIGRAIQVKNINHNAKYRKGPLSHRKIKCLFWIMFNFWWSAKQSEQKTHWRKYKKTKKTP